MAKRSSTQRKFGVERLENRELFAGNVLAYMNGAGDLNLLEATADIGEGQAVQVHQIAANRYRVTGLYSQDGGTTLINGGAYRDYTVYGNVNINLAGGRDTVLVGRTTSTTFNKDVYINSGVDFASGYTDLDSISVEKVTTKGHLTIDSGASADYINVIGSKIGDNIQIDNLAVYAGSGADYVNVLAGYGRFIEVSGNLHVDTYDSFSELDADRVTFQGAYSRGNVQAFLGGGADTLSAIDVFAGNDVYFSTGAGDDKMSLNSVRAYDDFWALLGDGNDSLDMQYSVADVLTLDGGAGYDSLSTAVPGPVNQQITTNWEMINGRRVFWTNFGDDLTTFSRS
jgi:hypothetical protein